LLSSSAAARPDVPLGQQLGEFETLLSMDKADGLLGCLPRHSWRERFGATA